MVTDLIKLLGGHVISNEDELKNLLGSSARVHDRVVTKNGQGYYLQFNYDAPDIIDLSPDKLTQSTFTDLLKEPEENK